MAPPIHAAVWGNHHRHALDLVHATLWLMAVVEALGLTGAAEATPAVLQLEARLEERLRVTPKSTGGVAVGGWVVGGFAGERS